MATQWQKANIAKVLDGAEPLPLNPALTSTEFALGGFYAWNIPDGGSADYDRTVIDQIEVIDVVAMKAGVAIAGAGNKIQLKKVVGAVVTNITDLMEMPSPVGGVVRPTSLDPTARRLLAGEKLRVTIFDNQAGATDLACDIRLTVARLFT